MGKRKYNEETEGPDNKNKKLSEIQSITIDENEDQNETGQENNQNTSSKQNIFDLKHFRKELTKKQGQTMVLTQFLQVCLNPDSGADYLLEYLKVGGNSHEILKQISTDNKKNLTLATPTFHIFHLIILKVQSSMPHMIAVTEEACRYFLNTFIPTVEIMISENSGPRHRKVILNLLTSMVTLNSDLGVEVLSQVPLTPKHLQYIVEKPNYKEKDNVRTAFVHFMTSFLVDGHLPLIKALLEKQGLLGLVIPGLVQDEAEAVLMFLNILKKNVIDNNLISKTLKLKTFSHQVLHNLFKLFNWRGPPEISQELKNEARPEIVQLLSNIMLTLFTSHKYGLYFVDHSLGTSDLHKNQNLYKTLLSLKRPWENKDEADVVLQIILKCPDLHRAVVHIIEQSFQPQHSPIWERATHFVVQLLDTVKPEDLIPRLHTLSSTQAANFIRFITIPVPLLKLIQANFQADLTISVYCVKVLVKMLQSLKKYLDIFEMEESIEILTDLKSRLENFLPRHLPPSNVIVSLMNKIITNENEGTESSQHYKLPKINATDSLLHIIDLLLLYNSIYPDFFENLESSIDMKKILDFTKTLSSDNVALLKFKVISLWLILDPSAISLKNTIFKELFLIMLEVFTSEDTTTWNQAKETLYEFLKSTDIFEANDDEILLMLYTLRNVTVNPISLIVDVVEYVLENKNDLVEYTRSQMGNFIVGVDSVASNIDEVLTDLMNNRITTGSVYLENKLPSPFIIGCMQYIQSNRDAKKGLKKFLSLYIANLYHSNCIAELSEALIGDSKLEVRSYVADCTINPTPLPDSILKDDVLLKISRSVIEDEELSVNQVFSNLEECHGANDLIVNDIHYKINVTESLDSSQLFIWGKYLIFCVIQLSKYDKLSVAKQKKIQSYFKAIICTGKKHHKMDFCRSMLLNLFKNAHIRKIYRALDTNNNQSYILATDFLLHVIISNRDIVNYLNKKHFILRPYQQKTLTEIVKAFIKINKRKNINCDHTIAVLNVVGLSNEDDIKVLNHVFDIELASCVKDDKEPSVVLEVLRILLDKYSKSISLELTPDIIKKSIKLYTEMLVYTEVTTNLTNLELTLISYFENKPHHAIFVTDDDFRKFFKANTVRKTTASLASSLLQLNVCFCNVFKSELDRQDILSHRELTLPLANAAIEHSHFIAENNDFLQKLYEEYKLNIWKFLEKPHKVGQVYIQSWLLIKKLAVTCMSEEDCMKLFSKNHKFEALEISHIRLTEAILTRIYSKKDIKIDYFCNYALSMLSLISTSLKDDKLSDIDEVISIVYNTTKIDNIESYSDKEDLKKIIDTATWQNFCKIVLKSALKVSNINEDRCYGPKLLCLLTSFVTLLYPTDNSDIVTLFDMVTSHSEFLNVMLSLHSPDIKTRLLQFIYTLMQMNKSVMKSQQIPVFLSAYHATRSPSDRLILSILQFYESNGLPVNDYKPYIWGDSAANYYAVRKKRNSSLWSHPTPNQVLNLFDREVIDVTVRNYPVTQKLNYYFQLPPNCNEIEEGNVKIYIRKLTVKSGNVATENNLKQSEFTNTMKLIGKDALVVSQTDYNVAIYDPAFIFPLLSHLLAPGSMASCFKLLRCGMLSVVVMGLSSQCPLMRAAAFHVLHRFCLLLETETRHKNDKLLLTDFITTLRHSLRTAINQPDQDEYFRDLKNPKLPAIDALYLAKVLTVCTSPSDPLYKPANNFLIAKQFVDLTVVPDFLSLFHDNEVELIDRRLWILEIIRDGTKTMVDVNVIFKTMCLKMIMDFYTTVLCDRRSKVKILGVIKSIAAIPRAFEILLEGYSLMAWMNSIMSYIANDKSIVKVIINLIETIIHSLNIIAISKVKPNSNNTEIKVKSDVEYEVLAIIYELLNHIDAVDVLEVVEYVKLYNLISKRTLKFLSKKQLTNIVTKCSLKVKDFESVHVIKRAMATKDCNLLKSRLIDGNDSNAVLVTELHCLVGNYVL
ncbi:nucleolar pre-ribosomal-associated protein 1 [Leptidea sinapis]|uniref:nucleolar pre-ribosomal-associated protein 1 n=1 Tax=Leptidea sinapis TaxID=189913 RepID=UPI00212B8CEB|nr:nucleolar pre-ribosomal-associated protein 1 [Leptidea sinapis]